MTNEQRRAAIDVIQVIVELIASRPFGYPSGELYALLMDKVNFEAYQSMIEGLKRAKVITASGHLLHSNLPRH